MTARARLDVHPVERECIDIFSFSRDLLLLALTLGVVAGRHGAY